MAEKRDVLDELIDLQQDLNAVRNPLGDLPGQLLGEADDAPQYNPDDYKDIPRANATTCLRYGAEGADVCHRCEDVCPTAAIGFEGKQVIVDKDACRKCGLCIAVCPTETLVAQRQMSRKLYDRIARAASTYEQVYVTCTRALGRIPQGNEICLPCVGVISRELWFALLADYGNLSVYLPLGICDRCRTTTGEEVFAEAIADAEEHSCENVGLEVDEAAMTHSESRAYRRKQFMSSMQQAGTQLITRTAAPLAGAAAVANRMKAHTEQINALQRTLEQATGGKTAQSRRRLLTQSRKLVLSTLQSHPELAPGMSWQVPSCDLSRCTMCGDCAKVCTQHACSLDESGRFSVEAPYCLNCGACAKVCPEGALTMVAADPQVMVIPDPVAEQAAKQKAQIHEAKAQARAKGRAAAKKGLDALETFANALSEEYKD